MSERIQTSIANVTMDPLPKASVATVAKLSESPNRRWHKVLIGLVLFALAFFILLPPGASQLTFFYIRPGMPRWLVEYIVGPPGYFNQPEFYDYDAVWQGFHPPPLGSGVVSHWLTNSLAAVVSYDANGRVLEVEYRERRWWEEKQRPRRGPTRPRQFPPAQGD